MGRSPRNRVGGLSCYCLARVEAPPRKLRPGGARYVAVGALALIRVPLNAPPPVPTVTGPANLATGLFAATAAFVVLAAAGGSNFGADTLAGAAARNAACETAGAGAEALFERGCATAAGAGALGACTDAAPTCDGAAAGAGAISERGAAGLAAEALAAVARLLPLEKRAPSDPAELLGCGSRQAWLSIPRQRSSACVTPSIIANNPSAPAAVATCPTVLSFARVMRNLGNTSGHRRLP